MMEVSPFYTSEPKTTIIWGTAFELQSETDRIYFHFRPFFTIYRGTPDNSENQNFEKMKMSYLFTLVYQKSLLYDVSFLRNGMQQTTFCRFVELLPHDWPKIKIWKKWKKHLKILSFYTCVPWMKIIWCMVPEIWCVTGRIFSFWTIFCPLTLLTTQKMKILKKWE